MVDSWLGSRPRIKSIRFVIRVITVKPVVREEKAVVLFLSGVSYEPSIAASLHTTTYKFVSNKFRETWRYQFRWQRSARINPRQPEMIFLVNCVLNVQTGRRNSCWWNWSCLPVCTGCSRSTKRYWTNFLDLTPLNLVHGLKLPSNKL